MSFSYFSRVWHCNAFWLNPVLGLSSEVHIAEVMFYRGSQGVHVATTTVVVCKTPTLHRTTWCFVSQVVFSGITLRPHGNPLGVGTPWLADSLMMMQLRHHYWEVTNLQQSMKLLATPTIPYLAGQHTVELWLRRITYAADDNAIRKNEGSASPHT